MITEISFPLNRENTSIMHENGAITELPVPLSLRFCSFPWNSGTNASSDSFKPLDAASVRALNDEQPAVSQLHGAFLAEQYVGDAKRLSDAQRCVVQRVLEALERNARHHRA